MVNVMGVNHVEILSILNWSQFLFLVKTLLTPYTECLWECVWGWMYVGVCINLNLKCYHHYTKLFGLSKTHFEGN